MTPSQTPRPRFEPDRCANCFGTLPDREDHKPALFCTDLCQEYARVVRYWRTVARNGDLETDAGVREALETKIAHLLAGGYNATARRITREARALVIERDKVCVSCGRPGEEIDHIDGDSNDPGNLQLLCKDCHHTKTRSHFVPAGPEMTALIDGIERDRVLPDEPSQLCDDDMFWKIVESQIRRERIARIRGTEPGYGKWGMTAVQMLEVIPTLSFVRAPIADDGDDDFESWGEDDDSGFGDDSYYTRAINKDD